MMTGVTLNLSQEDAELFLKFRQHQDTFEILERSGVFALRNGHAVLNFDADGTLTDITGNMKLFRRGKTVIPILITE